MAESIFGKAEKTYIMENMQIDNLKKANFWNLSAEYETKFEAISPERLKIIKQYAINYNTPGDTTAVRLAARMIENGEKYDRFYKSILTDLTNCHKIVISDFEHPQALCRFLN